MRTVYAVFVRTTEREWATSFCDTREDAEGYISALESGLAPGFATHLGIAEALVDEATWFPFIGTKQLPRVDPVESNET